MKPHEGDCRERTVIGRVRKEAVPDEYQKAALRGMRMVYQASVLERRASSECWAVIVLWVRLSDCG